MGSFTIQLTEKPDIMLKRAEKLAKSNGVKFKHNGKLGSFSHLGVNGTFKITRNRLEVKYTKPLFITDSMVETQIRKVLG
jgi:hypothetical protein